jgi:homoserine kinase type II
LRFAWLSEWLRRDDREMVDLEAVFIGLLLENRETLEKGWG